MEEEEEMLPLGAMDVDERVQSFEDLGELLGQGFVC